MIHQDSTLVTFFRQIDEIPHPKQEVKQAKGHPKVYSDRLFLKGLVFMGIRHIRNIHEFHSMFQYPTPELDEVRLQISEHGRFIVDPFVKTGGRAVLRATLPFLAASVAPGHWE
jgi:hypothetical protein